MESSPLAAMHPQQVPSWSSRKDVYHGFQTFNPSSFDFKTISMAHQKPPARRDYFSLRPVRGSSPTSSLTADLDANFHIDKSPQAPTPRRSLFTADLFRPREDAVRMNTPPVDIEPSGTPPIMSSPPYGEAMDISPLPHKIPHFVAQVTIPSPSPETSPSDGDVMSPNDSTPGFSEEPTPPESAPTYLELPDRARRPATRPTLIRSKVACSYGIPHRPSSSETQLPPFRFGHFGHVATGNLTCSSTPSLLESFNDSTAPAEDSRPSGMGAMLPPPRRTSLSVSNRSMGSPSSNHVRKPAVGRGAFMRPQRKLIRRSLSMFQHPDDVMKEEQESFEPRTSALDSVMDMESDHTLKLPHFMPEGEPDSLPRISQETMVDLLDSKFNDHYDRIMIVDCRFEYEYNGGHIDNAVNFNDKQQLAQELFGSEIPANTCLILHCEYSVHRAPLTAKFIRGHDRSVNAANYPNLTYPELYLLDGGYSKFFAEHRSKCYPQNYVEMNDQRHHQECEREMAKVKATGRHKLFRNQTFAFGQGSDEMEDSPTGLGRATVKHQNSYPAFSSGADISEGIGQSFQRRMASY